MAVLDSSSTSLARVSSHGRGGLSYFAYALLFVLYAVVGRWMVSTVGEPRATAVSPRSALVMAAEQQGGMGESWPE